jgi:hypothetical protein
MWKPRSELRSGFAEKLTNQERPNRIPIAIVIAIAMVGPALAALAVAGAAQSAGLFNALN